MLWYNIQHPPIIIHSDMLFIYLHLLGVLMLASQVLSFYSVANNEFSRPPCLVLNAMIFYPEGDDEPALDDDKNTPSNPFSPVLEKTREDLVYKLSSKQDVLARLASAFSPEQYPIELKQINSIRCASLDSKHLEIEAITCDNLDCNSLLVSVDFPNECLWDAGTPNFEDCVMKNVDVLDQFHDQTSANHTTIDSVYETLESATELLREAPLIFPEGWALRF